jgi:hypothetical protein
VENLAKQQPLLSDPRIINMAAVDLDFFCHTFFPRAFRGKSPDFAGRLDAALENPLHRLLNLRVFRGGAKTTKLRGFMARRLAYGTSRTILYIGASEGHATRSVQWLRGQIDAKMGKDGVKRATPYAQTFGLVPGKKWQEQEIEVVQQVPRADGTFLERNYWIMGVGITGSIRGINFDDYRPDLIILDDVLTDENAATPAQRESVNNLIMGAILNSLAPATEEPNAKLVMLQTPLDGDDASARAEQSSEWHTEVFSCWTPETEDLPIGSQKSSWESRYPTETLTKQKRAAIAENRYSIFAREMEVRLVAAETRSFVPQWLRKYDEPPREGVCVMSIDPVPPPSEAQLKKGLKGKDYEAISIVARSKGHYYLLDYAINRGHDPSWTSAKFFEFIFRYRPQCCVLSLVAAERYLKWFLEQEMARKRTYLALKEAPIGKVSKFNRITAAIHGAANQGRLWCSPQHAEFILQFESFGIGYKGHDDLLESVSNGVAELSNPFLELVAEGKDPLSDEGMEDFPLAHACP